MLLTAPFPMHDCSCCCLGRATRFLTPTTKVGSGNDQSSEMGFPLPPLPRQRNQDQPPPRAHAQLGRRLTRDREAQVFPAVGEVWEQTAASRTQENSDRCTLRGRRQLCGLNFPLWQPCACRVQREPGTSRQGGAPRPGHPSYIAFQVSPGERKAALLWKNNTF